MKVPHKEAAEGITRLLERIASSLVPKAEPAKNNSIFQGNSLSVLYALCGSCLTTFCAVIKRSNSKPTEQIRRISQLLPLFLESFKQSANGLLGVYSFIVSFNNE